MDAHYSLNLTYTGKMGRCLNWAMKSSQPANFNHPRTKSCRLESTESGILGLITFPEKDAVSREDDVEP
jgi:hypothetical protein